MKEKKGIPEELKKELLSDIEITKEKAKLRENKGQLIVGIPNNITRRLELKKGDELRFIVKGNHKGKKLEVEVIRNVLTRQHR